MQIDTVVILTHQNQIMDPEWIALLHCARNGECTSSDLSSLCSLILSDPHYDVPNFLHSPWKDAVLITPRNSVQTQWNTFSLAKYCTMTGTHHYRAPSRRFDM
ncbi:hypothetical protein J3R82DRAFT_9692 [Butyriboletus roseoflavus]|nr:hypothetical protein J3R82DRAFT_9692 [Butyriboletus roseoflavus]